MNHYFNRESRDVRFRERDIYKMFMSDSSFRMMNLTSGEARRRASEMFDRIERSKIEKSDI